MAELALLGVRGRTLPTKKSKVITASDFTIGGIIGQFERSFKKAFPVNSVEDKEDIFGKNVIESYYGSDSVGLFFANLDGTKGKLYIKAHVATDAVTAFANIADQNSPAADTLKLEDAYQDTIGYGDSGNRTGYTITNGARLTTAIATAGTSADAFILVDSVAKMVVGDIIKIQLTGGSAVTVYKKITAINASLNRVEFSGAIHATSNAALDDVVEVLGFRLRTYRRSMSGLVVEVDANLGQIWCTMEPEVSEFYVQNVFVTSNWLKASDLASASLLEKSFPANVSAVTYLASGADGTSPTTDTHWAPDLQAFNGLPVRFLCNPETTLEAVNKAGEAYCNARWDKPKWMYNLPENQNKSQLLRIGASYQRADEVSGTGNANWYQISDPFANSPIAPPRNVPNVGAIMGLWVRSINTNGIHWIPAIQQMPLRGIVGIVGETFSDSEQDRTDLANAGINLTQNLAVGGTIIKNMFTFSTTLEFQFANGILMKSYFLVSFVDSLKDTENEPNTFPRIRISAAALTSFYYRHWTSGSTGNAPAGETFGQLEKEDGSLTQPQDHYQVKADIFNNPTAQVVAGQRVIDSWFSYPAPAGTIIIGVGFFIPS